MELHVVDGKSVMDSRDIANLTGKRHSDVLRDIKEMLYIITPERNFASGYFDKNGQSRPCYRLPYRETMILLSGYSTELRTKVIDRWLGLEFMHRKIREDAKLIRNNFTQLLKTHGYAKPHEYIQTTIQMKKALGITAKKENMTSIELKKIKASEALADLIIDEQSGYYEVNPICVESCKFVIEQKNKRKVVSK
jgi:phage regulator Rha-like protein